MAPPGKRTASRNTDGPKKTTKTKPGETGVVLEVSAPMDLWYLCEKVGFAQLNPFFRSDGIPMYQRVVTQLIRLDCEMFRYAFPYAGEVGYDMTKSPPEPIMSRASPHRPSSFPLSQYRAIKQEGVLAMLSPWLAVEKELLSTAELEAALTLESNAKRPQPMMNAKGLIRIPDVIRVKNFALGGKPQFSQANIHNVIEVKFAGDSLGRQQLRAYREIAGNPDNFRLLQTKTCDGRKSRTRDWVRSATKEPVYVPVGQAMKMAAKRRNGLPFISEYQLLVDRIDHEHEEVRREITPRVAPASEPQLRPGPTAEEEQLRRDQERRAVASMELTLMGPFSVAAGATVMIAAPIVFGGAAATETVVAARAGAQILQFPRVLRPLAAGAGAAATSYKLAAQPLPDPPVTLQPLPTAYVYWPD